MEFHPLPPSPLPLHLINTGLGGLSSMGISSLLPIAQHLSWGDWVPGMQ